MATVPIVVVAVTVAVAVAVAVPIPVSITEVRRSFPDLSAPQVHTCTFGKQSRTHVRTHRIDTW